MDIFIKPHHFVDIMKLYGTGIDIFVPDPQYQHDFYRIANMIIQNPLQNLILITQCDDICEPCLYCHQQQCLDTLVNMNQFSSKQLYNQALDHRMIDYLELNEAKYTVIELCKILLEKNDFIFAVWQEENDLMVVKRHHYFMIGVQKYLKKNL